MANNLVVSLLLNTGTFDNNLRTAKVSIEGFKAAANKAGESISSFSSGLGVNVGALAKFGTAVGVAAAAGAGLKAAIESNQTTGDQLASTLYTLDSITNQFAVSIGTMDFSIFNGGIEGMITRAQEAYTALDQLGNTMMSYGIINAKVSRDIAKARSILRDKNATEDEKKEAQKLLNSALKEANNAAATTVYTINNAIQKQVNELVGFSFNKAEIGNSIDKALELDATKGRDKIKNQYKIKYEEWAKQNKALQDERFNAIASISDKTSRDKTVANIDKRIRDLGVAYKDSIIGYTLLVKIGDEKLNEIGQQRTQAYNIQANVYNQRNQANRIANGSSGNTGNGGTGKANEAKKLHMENLKLEDEQFKELNEILTRINFIFDEQMKWYDKDSQEFKNLLKQKEDAVKAAMAKFRLLTNKSTGNGASDTYTAAGIKDENNPWKAKMPNKIEPTKLPNALAEYDENGNGILELTESQNKGMAEQVQLLNTLSSSFSMLGSTMSQMGEEGREAAKVMVAASQAVSLAGIIEAAIKDWSTMTLVGKIAAVFAGVATITSLFASISQFETGGIVGGNSYRGDNVLIRANSGEMILNNQQQANLFKLLNNGNISSGANHGVEFKIKGQELVGVLKNYNSKVGKVL